MILITIEPTEISILQKLYISPFIVLGNLICRIKSRGGFRLHFCFPYLPNTELLDARGTVASPII